MAFDTVIDKAQLEAAMKATADAIREKTGDTANCTWDPAQGFAALIAAIESGGSGGAIAYGSFTPAENMTTVTINHNLGKKPTFVCVWQDTYYVSNAYQINSLVLHSKNESQMWRLSSGVSSSTSTYHAGAGTENVGQSFSVVNKLSTANVVLDLSQLGSYKFISGRNYAWVCLVEG